MTPIWISINLFFRFSTPGNAWDYVFERKDHSHNLNAGRLTFDVHVERVNHSDYALTGNVTYLSPFTHSPDHYYHSMHFYISNWEEHHFEKEPVHYPRVTYCEFINTSYRKHIMKSVKSPVSSDHHTGDSSDDLCQGFRAEQHLVFYIHRYLIDKSASKPPISDGLIRIETLFELDDSVIVGVVLVVRVETDPDLRNEITMF